MEHLLVEILKERIASGLTRKSIVKCSKWAEKYRVMGSPFPGPWTFKHHPWLRDMHDSLAEVNIGQKSAQMGYTETVLNLTFFNVDVRGIDCLYVLPALSPDASNFSAARFDPALELSPHLSRIFSEVKNVGHKRAGTTNLYIRGSRSRSGLKSVPVGCIILDEVDEMNQKNVPLAFERASGQVHKLAWLVSTATIPGHGINEYYGDSSQNHFTFKCPCCDRFIELNWPDNIVVTGDDINDPRLDETHLICDKCKGVLPHETKHVWLQNNEWIETVANRPMKGWYINQMYSSTVSPKELAVSNIKAQTDRGHEQEFWNSKMGLPHTVDGARLTGEEVKECYADYMLGDSPRLGHLKTMGVDVGRWLHFEIDQWILPDGASPGGDINMTAHCRMLLCGKVREFEELDDLMRNYGINYCVIDAQPERRKSFEFANRFYGHVRTCFYPNGLSGKMIHNNDDQLSVSVDRTSWMDISLGRIRRSKPYMHLPRNLPNEYLEHVTTPVRVYEYDQNGNPYGMYIKKESEQDHYAHARTYAEIALPLAAGIGSGRDIKSPM